MNLEIHLHFNGDCKEAFEFYADVLGGTIETLLSYGESATADPVATEHIDKIVHASMRVENLIIAGADVLTGYHTPEGFNIILQLHSEDDAKEKFELLAEGGEVEMPLQSTFWSNCYGIVRDRFGIPWEINCS